MKLIAKGPADFAQTSHVGKQWSCPSCGAMNEVEPADNVGAVTTGNGGGSGGPQVQHYEMPKCAGCKRPQTVKPWALHTPYIGPAMAAKR